MKKSFFLLIAFVPFLAFAQTIDSAWFVNNYTKTEIMVPMRDGTKLFTTIYAPKDNTLDAASHSSVRSPTFYTKLEIQFSHQI